MKLKPAIHYGSFSAMRVRVKRSWDQRTLRWGIRLITWLINQRKKRITKLRQKVHDAPNLELAIFYQNQVDFWEASVVNAQKKIREMQHVYVNLYICPYRKASK